MDNQTSLIIKIINTMYNTGKSKIEPYHKLYSDLNLDSIDVYNLIMEFEDVFDICISDDEVKVDESISYYSSLVTRLKHEQHK